MFTPLAFCLFLVAGELLLRRGVLPIVRWMQVPVTAAAESLRGRGLVAFGGLVGTLRSGMREMDERPAGEERLAPQPAKDSGGGPPAADSSSMRRSSSLGDTGGVGGDTDEAAEEAAGAQEAGAAAHGGATGGPCSPAAGDTAEPGEDAKDGQRRPVTASWMVLLLLGPRARCCSHCSG
ncbi:unnamed protein product [Prorocentrum cordatum]|uniref:Uncharacterized protein n=1 Tax=Prorocentrum cordatum TaxID=2364126 RepID=A0ABN9WQF0_9DINO|nr:unnamed protein product [Polarella glacialis]